MCSDTFVRARHVLHRLLNLLDDTRLKQAIDEPIDAAVAQFVLPEASSLSPARFNDLVTGFMQHIYTNGVRFSRKLSSAEAFSEAFHILNSLYGGQPALGYDIAAALAEQAGSEAARDILASVAGAVKQRERALLRHWAYTTEVHSLSWEAKCELARACLEHSAGCIRKSLTAADSAELAEDVVDLVELHLAANQAVQQAFGPACPLAHVELDC